MSKWDSVRQSFERAHNDLFDSTRYDAEFFNYTDGEWVPEDDEFTGETRTSIGSTNVELVPPAIDSTVNEEGTSFDWSTSIRSPESDAPVSSFKPLGTDNERPTEVDVTDQKDDSTETYELHGYNNELGSGMIMVRLVEK